jgi:ATP-dependent DNA helicase HFM1/MER3
VLASLANFPKYFLKIEETSISSSKGSKPIDVVLSIHCGFIAEKMQTAATKEKAGVFDMTIVLTLTSDLDFIDFRRIP